MVNLINKHAQGMPGGARAAVGGETEIILMDGLLHVKGCVLVNSMAPLGG